MLSARRGEAHSFFSACTEVRCVRTRGDPVLHTSPPKAQPPPVLSVAVYKLMFMVRGTEYSMCYGLIHRRYLSRRSPSMKRVPCIKKLGIGVLPPTWPRYRQMSFTHSGHSGVYRSVRTCGVTTSQCSVWRHFEIEGGRKGTSEGPQGTLKPQAAGEGGKGRACTQACLGLALAKPTWWAEASALGVQSEHSEAANEQSGPCGCVCVCPGVQSGTWPNRCCALLTGRRGCPRS